MQRRIVKKKCLTVIEEYGRHPSISANNIDILPIKHSIIADYSGGICVPMLKMSTRFPNNLFAIILGTNGCLKVRIVRLVSSFQVRAAIRAEYSMMSDDLGFRE